MEPLSRTAPRSKGQIFQAQKLENVWPYFVPLGLSARSRSTADGGTQKKAGTFYMKRYRPMVDAMWLRGQDLSLYECLPPVVYAKTRTCASLRLHKSLSWWAGINGIRTPHGKKSGFSSPSSSLSGISSAQEGTTPSGRGLFIMSNIFCRLSISRTVSSKGSSRRSSV